MLILIDGYNVIAPVAPPGGHASAPANTDTGARRKAQAARLGQPLMRGGPSDWLHRERMRLIDRLAKRLDRQLAEQTCVVFDSASSRSRGRAADRSQPDATSRIGGIDVRFAVNHDEADDLIEELIELHSSPKRLTVVSSDRRLQTAARRSGATAFDSQPWFDALLDGKLGLAIPWPPDRPDAPGTVGDHGPAGVEEKSAAVDQTTVLQWMQAFGVADPPPGDPKRPLSDDRLFPEGYGEDLL